MKKLKIKQDEMAFLDEFKGKIVVEDGGVLVPKEEHILIDGAVLMTGNARIEGKLKARRLTCAGWLEVAGTLEIEENLRCDESLSAEKDIIVGHAVNIGDVGIIRGSLGAQVIKVGGKLKVDGETRARIMKVGGSVELQDVFCTELKVGGKAVIAGTKSMIDVIKVGGSAEINGGKFEQIKVGGHLWIGGDVVIGTAKSGGVMESQGNIKANKIVVGGQLVHAGNLEANRLKVGGKTLIKGNVVVKEMSIGGKLIITQDAFVHDVLKVGSVATVMGTLNAHFVVIGAELSANRVLASEVRVGGKLAVKEHLRSEYFQLGKKGRCEGQVIADEIVILDESIINGSLQGEIITLKRGVRVKGTIQYVKELIMEEDVELESAPRQVSSLPEMP